MEEDKPILVVETSGKQCGAAIYYSDEKYYEISINNKNIHSEKLFDIIDFVITSSGAIANKIDYIAFSNGPGSFTGLRIGLSAVKGMAAGLNIPILPVPTFEAIALELSCYLPLDAEYYVANKVNTDEVYLEKFKKTEDNFITIDPLKIVPLTEVKKLSGRELIFGNAVIDNKIRNISFPKPLYIAKWAKLFGKEKILKEFDYFEPDYIKEFLIKGVKNV